MFDGPNILLKLHVDRFLLIARYGDFHIRPVWLEVAYSRPLGGEFLGLLPQMNSDIVAAPKGTVLGRKYVP